MSWEMVRSVPRRRSLYVSGEETQRVMYDMVEGRRGRDRRESC